MAAQIPRYQRRVAPDVASAPRAIGSSPDLSGAGQSLSRFASDLDRIQQQEVEDANKTAFINADNQLGQWQNKALFDPEAGAFTKKGSGALGLTQSTLSEYDKQQTTILESLTNERQKQMFQQSSLARRGQLEAKLGSYEFGEHQVYKDDVDKSSIQLSMDSAALNYNDPQAVEQNRLKMNAVYEQRAERLGWSPEEKEAELQKANSALSQSVIQRMVIDSPQNAKGLYEQYKGSMTADDQVRTTSTIDQAFRRQEAEARQRQVEARQLQAIARQELSSRLSDAQTALMSGVMPADMPNRHEILSAYGEKQGPRVADQLEKLQTIAPAVQELRTASPEQTREILDAHDPVKNAVVGADGIPVVSSGFKTDNEVHSLIARAATQFQQQRNADPAAYVIQTTPAVQNAYIAAQQDPTPENNSAYITASVAEQRRQGIAAPKILPAAQASALANSLTQTPPDQQAKLLSELSANYGSAYTKVLEQVSSDAPVQIVAGMVGSANKNIQVQRSGVFSQGLGRSPEFIQNTLLSGEAALKSKAYKLPPSQNAAGDITNGPDKAFYDAANGLLDPQSMKTYHAAFQSYYAGRAIQEGKYGEGYQASYAREALAAIGLTPVEVGVGKTLPPYGMDPNAFKDQVSAKFEAYRKEAGTTHSLDDVKIYAGPGSTYIVRDALGNQLTTIKVDQ